jgi:MFS family permease
VLTLELDEYHIPAVGRSILVCHLLRRYPTQTLTISYSPFDIGLFGLLGIIGAILAPVWGRLVDRIVPWSGQFIGMSLGLVSMVIALAAADRSIGGVIVPMILFDCGAQLYAVSNSYRVAGIDPKARARLNGCVLFCMFVGQVSDVLPSHMDLGSQLPEAK